MPIDQDLPTRRALTLVEVLIAMGLLTLGLLGVAAIFPVGGHFARTGDVTDQANAIAQAALEDAVIRGYLDPQTWVLQDFGQAAPNAEFINYLDGNASNTRPGLRQAITEIATPALNPTLTVQGQSQAFRNTYTSKLFGGAYVIDPLAIASITAGMQSDPTTQPASNPLFSTPMRRFPAHWPWNTNGNSAWNQWMVGAFQWPVRRITTVHNAASLNQIGVVGNMPPGSILPEPVAIETFTASDDFASTLPNSGDEPARGRWESWFRGNDGPYASRRQVVGDYSWIITVAPSSSTSIDSMASQPDAALAEVSATVFYKRPLPADAESALESERITSARVVAASPNGGELLLERMPMTGSSSQPLDEPETSPFESLRGNEYVMVVGPHPLSTPQRPQLAVRWCRVLNTRDSGTVTPFGDSAPTRLDGDNRVLVALRGPDWPWRPVAPNGLGQFAPANDLRVAIVPGAVAVHTKTMRLESGSPWSIN